MNTYRPVLGTVFSWLSQWSQYKSTDTPGFHLQTEEFPDLPGYPVDCLLLYADDGELVGILNRYAKGVPGWEVPGAVNIWVHPKRQRQGLGQSLLVECERRWGPIDWSAQKVTPAGYRLAERYRSKSLLHKGGDRARLLVSDIGTD